MNEELLREISTTSSRIRGVASWLRNDSNARFLDPNADELVEMMVRANNIRNNGGELPADVTQSLSDVWENRKANYEKNGIGTNCTSYEMLNDLHDGALSREVIGPHCFEALRRIARGALYASQVRRDGNPNYVWDDFGQLGVINDEYELSSEHERSLLDPYMKSLQKKVTNVPGLTNEEKNMSGNEEGNQSGIIDLIEKGIEDTSIIFSPSEEQQGAFRKAWTEIVLTEVSRGATYGSDADRNPLYLYTSGGNMPTNNMKRALMESGISPSGELPERRCYCTESIPMTPELQLEACKLYKRFINGEELSSKVPQK